MIIIIIINLDNDDDITSNWSKESLNPVIFCTVRYICFLLMSNPFCYFGHLSRYIFYDHMPKNTLDASEGR